MHRATYSPEDNKLRIYPGGIRLDKELGDRYASFKAAGYKWAAKQECFVCPRWSPAAEDWALELCDEIEDEDYSYEERAADRAERFEGYREKRQDEAEDHADTFEAGPSAFGHQSRERAERQARRHDRQRGRAVTQWSKAEYWQRRTAGVISHALYKSSAHVRRGRILTLEAEQRKHEKSIERAIAEYSVWQKVADEADAAKATRFAIAIANASCGMFDWVHPRTGRESYMHSLLTDSVDPITGHEAAALYLGRFDEPAQEGSRCDRWRKHYELRLTYERAMLAEEGGTAAEADMIPGGWIGGAQILKVNKSNTTGRVVSVGIFGPHPWRTNRDGSPKMGTQTVNIERLGANVYRAPTNDELAAFHASQKAKKAERKATTPTAPPLVNPTDNDAERLQAHWNAQAEAKHSENVKYEAYKPSAVLYMTQAEYSARSKGAYSSCETRTLHACGRHNRRSSNMYTTEGSAYDKSLAAAVCKIRVKSGGGWYSATHVIVIADKPQKPLPLDWEKLLEAQEAVA